MLTRILRFAPMPGRSAQAALLALALTLSLPVPATLAAPVAAGSPTVEVLSGHSIILNRPGLVKRVAIANPAVAEVLVISPRELYVLGKTAGTTNLTIWGQDGSRTQLVIEVSLDVTALRSQIQQILPGERKIQISSAGPVLILSGQISDPVKLAQVQNLARAFVGETGSGPDSPAPAAPATAPGAGSSGGRVVSMLQVANQQQIKIDVKVAEVSRTMLDRLGVSFSNSGSGDGVSFQLISGLVTGQGGLLSLINGNRRVELNAEQRDGLIRILAEPTITAISGKEGSFLAGGTVFIPTSVRSEDGGREVELTEKEFGVSLRFVPLLLEDGKIQLQVSPEVSEVAQTGTLVSNGGASSILPTFTSRKASTTVELRNGESLAIGGLIRNNVNATVSKLPLLGDLPVIGALFRSTEFQENRTELVFVLTPTLVGAGQVGPLPTDLQAAPQRGQVLINGRLDVPRQAQP